MDRNTMEALLGETINQFKHIMDIVDQYALNNRDNTAVWKLYGKAPLYAGIFQSVNNRTPAENPIYKRLDDISLSQLLLICKDLSRLYNLPVYNKLKNFVLVTDPQPKQLKIPEGIFYGSSGNYIRTEGDKIHYVYSCEVNKEGNICSYHNVSTLEEFNIVTAAVFGESSGDIEESKGIADVLMNRSAYTGKTTRIIVERTGILGYTTDTKKITENGLAENINRNLINARAAVISMFLGNRGSSNGAYFWDGADIKSSKNLHYAWGFVFSDKSHDIYDIGDQKYKNPVVVYIRDINGKLTSGIQGTYDHMLISTVAIGRTIFWKFDSDYKKVNGNKEYDQLQ
jgi:hypothetical protein